MIARKKSCKMGQRNPNHQLIDGLSHGRAGFRWPIHSIFPNPSIWGCNGYNYTSYLSDDRDQNCTCEARTKKRTWGTAVCVILMVRSFATVQTTEFH